MFYKFMKLFPKSGRDNTQPCSFSCRAVSSKYLGRTSSPGLHICIFIVAIVVSLLCLQRLWECGGPELFCIIYPRDLLAKFDSIHHTLRLRMVKN